MSGTPSPTQLRLSASLTQLLSQLVGQLTRLPFHSGYATDIHIYGLHCLLYVMTLYGCRRSEGCDISLIRLSEKSKVSCGVLSVLQKTESQQKGSR